MYPKTRELILKTLRQASDAAKKGSVRDAIVFSRTAQALEDQAMDEPGGLEVTLTDRREVQAKSCCDDYPFCPDGYSESGERPPYARTKE